jgi:hypothetical protein
MHDLHVYAWRHRECKPRDGARTVTPAWRDRHRRPVPDANVSTPAAQPGKEPAQDATGPRRRTLDQGRHELLELGNAGGDFVDGSRPHQRGFRVALEGP